MGEDLSTEERAFRAFIAESDEDVIRNEGYEEAARLGWNAAMDYRATLEPDWEYDFTFKRAWKKFKGTGLQGGLTLKQALRYITPYEGDKPDRKHYRVVRRRKAGPWEKI